MISSKLANGKIITIRADGGPKMGTGHIMRCSSIAQAWKSLVGKVNLGSNIHIGAYTVLYGQYGIDMNDFSGLSARVILYSVNDDYSGNSLTNPTVPSEFKKNIAGRVRIGSMSS